MNELAQRIKHLIEMHGPIDIARFMTLASSHPTLGYYPAHAQIGASGDFLTAPEASQIFGELIGAWAATTWDLAGRPSPFRLIEPGPGRGTMLVDLMRATQQVPGFHQALDLHLVETSPMLRAVQQDAINHPRTFWHDDIKEVSQDGYGLVIANEFLDTLPIRQLQRWNGRWHDRLIGWDDDGSFVFVVNPHPSALASASGTLPKDVEDGAVIEFAPAREAFIAQLCDGLAACGGSALLIDYGDIDLAPGDSLQAVRRHARVDPLSAPGEADLTSRVTFAPLLDVARSRGITAWGPVGQGEFLRRLGLDARLQQLCSRANAAQATSLRRGAERLASGDGMGELFKVMALTTDTYVLPGFGAEER